MSTPDHIALTSSLTATLEMIDNHSRGTGRTTRMLENAKPHEAILVTPAMKRVIEHYYKRKSPNPPPTIISVRPSLNGLHAAQELSRRHEKIHIDHHLTHLLLLEWLQEFRRVIDNLEGRNVT